MLKRLVLVVALFLLLGRSLWAQTFPASFSRTQIATVSVPTGMAFTPDGRLLITSQTGSIRVYQGGALLPTPALSLPASQLCSDFERGLLSIAVDPGFASNGFVYVYYTFNRNASGSPCPYNSSPTNTSTPVNRVSRFTLPAGNVISPASELVLVDNILSLNGNHNGGDLHFGADGFLYISVGDSGTGGALARPSRLDVLSGKLLRVNSADGSPVPANPYFAASGARRCGDPAGLPAGAGSCQEIFAIGFRNPFRFNFRPATNNFYVNDVGQNLWEEIDDVVAGADYGWNLREGHCANGSTSSCSPVAGLTEPLFDYQHGQVVVPGGASNCNSITGGAFVPTGIWPAAYDGAWLFGDYVCGSIFRLSSGGPPRTAAAFGSGLGGVTTMIFGPFGTTQALYYTSYSGSSVNRVSYATTGNAPSAVASASPSGGPLPLSVSFSAAGSSDPDAGDTLTYFWTFGDGTPETSTTNLTIPHTYSTLGPFTASLRVRDQALIFSTPASLTIFAGNNPPVPTIVTPAAGAEFTVGQSVTLGGSATDAEDGALPASSLSWTVLLHHDTHFHPFLGPVSGNPAPGFTAPAPEDLLAATNSYLEVQLTATDSQGLTTTATRNFAPQKVNVSFVTSPSGLNVSVNGSPLTGPQTIVSWTGWTLNLVAPAQYVGPTFYSFGSWSDGGAASHAIVTPGTPASYTAAFIPTLPISSLHTITPCRVVDTRNADGPFGGPALNAATARTFILPGTCGIPSSAKSVVLNVSAVAPSNPGNLTIYPTGLAAPATSFLNFPPGLTRSNNGTVLLGNAGGVTVYPLMSTGIVHLLIDVQGYFE
ncbi:MAG: PQQ-dependent sugar dehydrogenase [Thermoanaerobaculia bacterium]